MTNYNRQRDSMLSETQEAKQNKCMNWPENPKKMLLNLFTVDGDVPAKAPPAAFLHIVNQPSVARAREELIALLAQENCLCNPPLKFLASLMSGDFVIYGSDEPGKLSIPPSAWIEFHQLVKKQVLEWSSWPQKVEV